MKRRLHAPSPALVISLIALFVALGGTSYAAIHLPRNSVGTKQLKKNAVTTRKIKKHAVTAAKINPKGLTVPNAKHAASADTATSATNATTAGNATQLGGVSDTGYALAGRPFVVQTLNGVGNEGGCTSGTLAVEVLDGRHDPVDARFTLMVGTTPTTYAQIRSDGSIRSSSGNVASVAHTAGSGIYCVTFTTTVPNGSQLEGAVTGFGTN